AAALDAHGDAGVGGFEGFRDLLGERQVHRGVVEELSLFPRRLDQDWRNRGRFRRRCPRGGRKQAASRGGRCLEDVAPGECGPCPLLRPAAAPRAVRDPPYTPKILL